MKANEKRLGMKSKVREEKQEEQHTGVIVAVATLVALISISGFIINSMPNHPSARQAIDSALPPLKAVIVDQLGLTFPDPVFIQTATDILKQAGYSVDYYASQKVTVGFYSNLPTQEYSLVIFRAHSSASELQGTQRIECPVVLFSSEQYSTSGWTTEQLTNQVFMVSYDVPQPPYYFAIGPEFVRLSMKGSFQNATIIIMGCDGLDNPLMAKAFIEKGAKICIGWTGSVSAGRTDLATTSLLQHVITEKQPIKEAVRNTIEEVGPDPQNKSQLAYYPLETGESTIENTK
jgi:hypothetical protein